MSSKPLVVIGGGISGLSCAYYLHKYCAHKIFPQKIIVIEAAKHLGGWMKSYKCPQTNVIHEFGPKSIRFYGIVGYNALSLAEEIGLSKEVIGTTRQSAAGHKRYLVVDNKLLEYPSKPQHLIVKRWPFTKSIASYGWKDLKTPRIDINQWGGDISVHDFFNHRMGEEIADYFFDPICRGITAGDSKKLSMISVFPSLFKTEQRYGNIVSGMVFAEKDEEAKYSESDLVVWAKNNKWIFWNLKEGVQTLPDTLCQSLRSHDDQQVEIYNESRVNKIEFNKTENSIKVDINTIENENISLDASAVFSAIPAQQLSSIISADDLPKLKNALNSIPSVHMACVHFEYKGQVLGGKSGFGYVVPSKVKSNCLGVTFDSCITKEFDAGNDITRMTVMMGGAWFEEIFGDVNVVTKEQLLAAALEDVRLHLKITSEPINHFVNINKNCIPQYLIGHRNKLKIINDEIKREDIRLSLIGSSYQGFSVPDCIFNAKLVAQSYAQSLGVS